MLTEDILRQLWPRGDSKVPGLIAGIAAAAPTIFPKYGLTDDLTIAHAMAQFSHECGAGTEMVENTHYSAERAAQVWPLQQGDKHPERHFADAADCYRKVGSFPGDPDFAGKLIDLVYGTRMGNRPGTHDGRNFIGRGLAQTTGREGYEKLAAKTGLDPVNHPELVVAPATALECGVADFVICGCLPFALKDDVDNVTLCLNGGHVGLAERTQWLARWKTALGNPTATVAGSGGAGPAPRGTLWVQQSLNTLGANPPLATDGDAGPATTAAVKAFQSEKGLTADGIAGPLTIAAIEAALPVA